MNIKSNKIVLAVIVVLSFVFAYLYDKWKYNSVAELRLKNKLIALDDYSFTFKTL